MIPKIGLAEIRANLTRGLGWFNEVQMNLHQGKCKGGQSTTHRPCVGYGEKSMAEDFGKFADIYLSLKDQTRRETNLSLLADGCGQSTCDFTRDADGGTLAKSDIGTGRGADEGDAEAVRMEF